MKQKEKGLELHWKMSISSGEKKTLATTVHSPEAWEMTDDRINVEKKGTHSQIQEIVQLFS